MKITNSTLIASLLMMITASLVAENPAEGARWNSNYGNPKVTVSIVNSKVTALVWSNIPATELQTFNSLLWNEHGEAYIKIKDFNADGKMDIGVMKGAGYGGRNICYAVYEYDEIIYSYKNKESMTICYP